jgi:hypothetical protein
MLSSASDVSCTVTRALTPSTASPPPNRNSDDEAIPDQALQEPPLSTDSLESPVSGQKRLRSAAIKMVHDLESGQCFAICSSPVSCLF